jgi:hypothetical protein
MTTIKNDKERRKQKRLETLGENNPACVICGENNPHCLELHHIAGRAYDDDMVIVCRNCHRKLSDDQKDHPQVINKAPVTTEIIGHFLLGLADLFLQLVNRLREFAQALIAMNKNSVT